MSYKVIVADDSQTIQKVINITLAKQPYHLIECLSEDALFSQLEKTKAELVCLDFNLSDRFSGPELAQKIKALSPRTQILFLLGTFDTVDDETMEKCGAADKIVKPFDSNKFISLCKRMTHLEPGIANPPHETSSFDDLESQWTVNDTVGKLPPQLHSTEVASSEVSFNALDQEMNEWGMSVPSIIDGPSSLPLVELPPVIEEKLEMIEADEIEPTHFATPSSHDLEYPEVKVKSPDKRKASELVSLETFKDYSEEIEIEGNYVSDDSDIHKLEELIKDEVEEDLWQVDELEDFKGENSDSKSSADLFVDEVSSDDDLFPRLDQNDVLPSMMFEESSRSSSVDKSEIEMMVQKYVKNYLDELFAEKIEQIAWDMIPDLAENLIRSELKKISTKVLEDQD